MKNILLQTTIEYVQDDWSIERFSILTDVLSSIEDPSGRLKSLTYERGEHTFITRAEVEM